MSTSEKAHSISILNSRIGDETDWNFNFYRSIFKRSFDFLFCILLLPLAIPLLAILMVLVKLDSCGPAIFRSERIGRGGKKFSCFKLRTMCLRADEKLAEILNTDEELKAEWEKDQKLKNDPRITKIGKVIRTLSLDELPQIFNVLKGEMSFVGPRPIVEEEISKYGKDFSAYISVRPGITGLWQTNGRNDISYKERVSLDKKYAVTNNFSTDLKILLKTIPAAISKKGAY